MHNRCSSLRLSTAAINSASTGAGSIADMSLSLLSTATTGMMDLLPPILPPLLVLLLESMGAGGFPDRLSRLGSIVTTWSSEATLCVWEPTAPRGSVDRLEFYLCYYLQVIVLTDITKFMCHWFVESNNIISGWTRVFILWIWLIQSSINCKNNDEN